MHGTVRLNVWEEQYRLCSRVFGGPFQGSQLSNDPPVGYLISRKTKTYNYFWERSKKNVAIRQFPFRVFTLLLGIVSHTLTGIVIPAAR